MKQYFLILSFVIFTFKLAFAQNSAFAPPSIPTSPQAEAFKKYGEYSINYQTGVPDISIPLFEINHYGYKLPLTLSYNPIPLKPGYNYDVFGRGWSLSLRSCISRSIEYAPDEWSDFLLEDIEKEEFKCLTSYNCPGYSCFKNINFGLDQFNAILPDGSSFDFVIQKVNGIRTFSIANNRKLKIDCIAGGINIVSFTIVDENGIKYSFEESDYLNTSGYLSNVTWHLTRIDLPNTDQQIILNYELTIQGNINCLGEPNIMLTDDGYGNPTNTYVIDGFEANPTKIISTEPIGIDNSYRMKLLSKISYNKTNIILNYKNQDTFSDYNPPKNFYIDNIEIIESERLIKKINYDIETSPFLSNLTSALQLGTLNAIFLNSGELNTEKYNLIYQGSNSFFFNGTDHWGNLNWQSDNYGKVGNFNTYVQSDLFQVVSDYPPSIKLLAEPYSDENPTRFTKIKLQNSFNFNEDERKPLGTESHGVLKQITYPTRGYTEFEFENHEFLTANDLNGDYITDPVNRIKSKASGFRIKSIINHSADGLIATAKHYRYGAKCINASYPNSIEHTGIGEAVVDPNILTYLDYTDVDLGMRYDNYPVKEMVLGKAIEYDYTRSSNYWECNFNSLNFRRLVNGRAPVVYSEVTVYYGDCLDDNYLILPVKTHGKTVFKYDLSDPVEGYVQSSHFEILKAIGTTMYYDEKKDFYNKLSEQLDYSWENNQYKIKSKDVYSWDYNFWNSGVLNYICSNRLPSSILSLLKPYVYSLSDGNGQHKAYSIYNSFNIKDEYIKYVTLNSKTTTQFSLGGDSVKSISKFNYDGYARLQSTTKDNQTTKLKYPDYFSSPVFDKMVEKNMIAPIVSSEVDYKGKTQAGNKTIFKEFQFGDQTLILPAEGYKLEIKPSGNEYSLENQILKYTKNGNPMELVTKDDVHTCYIWSYDDRYMVASIVGASYNTTGDIVSGTTTFTKSKIDAITNSTTTESDYFQKLAEVRSMLTNSQVSTYTYKPLIGISTMTDPRGVTTYYEYDTFNRLKQTYIIENGEKKILQKNDYHYANQQ